MGAPFADPFAWARPPVWRGERDVWITHRVQTAAEVVADGGDDGDVIRRLFEEHGTWEPDARNLLRNYAPHIEAMAEALLRVGDCEEMPDLFVEIFRENAARRAEAERTEGSNDE